MPKVAILISDINLRGGGERVAANMANYFSQYFYYDVTLVSVVKSGAGSCFELNEKVKIAAFNLNDGKSFFRNLAQKISAVKQIYRKSFVDKFDCLIGIGTYPSCLAALIPNNTIIRIGSEHLGYLKTPLHWRMLRRIIYPRLDHVVFLTQYETSAFGARFKNSRCIPNFHSFYPDFGSDVKNHQILNIGRLTDQKNQLLLLEIFSELVGIFPDWKLKIIGDGELKESLESKIQYLGIQDNCTLAKGTSKIQDEYLASSIFVLTSKSEGFPMVLLESQACGLPMVSVDCESGPNEIISDGYDGFIVPVGNQQKMIEKLTLLMGNQALRQRMSKNARERAKLFSANAILPKWKKLIEQE